MNDQSTQSLLTDAPRELLVHALYEAAELEHNLMCTYLYAAFSLKSGTAEGLSETEATAVARWRQEIIAVAIDEMSHLTAVWNITAALGAVPHVGRTNFPLDPGYLPARVVVRLAPFGPEVLQHFIHLERSAHSDEPDGEGFAPERLFVRGTIGARLTPMGIDYATVGEFYASLAEGLRGLVTRQGEAAAFCGDPTLQLSAAEVDLPGARRVICLKSALAAFDAIIVQGEGAPEHAAGSHFERFCAIRQEYRALKCVNPDFKPSHPAATNPVLRRPPRPEGRVWIEDEPSIAVVDLANAGYGVMLRLLAYAYAVPAPHPDKALALDLAISLMQAVTPLGERAARLPAGPSNPDCHAGMSFTTLRNAAPLNPGPGARRFFVERLAELATAASALRPSEDARVSKSARVLAMLAQRAAQRFDLTESALAPAPAIRPVAAIPTRSLAPRADEEVTSLADGVETVEGRDLTLMFEAQRCIHARFCVTGAPAVFLANVKGPWIHPNAMDTERLVDIAHACPSGAIQYQRKDGRPDEPPPPVNLVAIREAGPYAVRGTLRLDGADIGYRATLCRCGASRNKPFCDGSHHEIHFDASGEPASTTTDMLPVRDGPLAIDPQPDGPLQVRGNLEITTGTGRVVTRLTTVKLCRCGGSATKPFCDGSHARIGFRSSVP
ncbi:MAG TPA: ferritin-like domain-containing protein [Candidatus Limnocylindrales bacterium]|nr:ferritin-like domain-containing protein [Candidatus Limnocylindrales bacterium]